MKPQNRYRQSQGNVKQLEKKLSLVHRLFSMLAFKRGTRRMLRWLKLCVLLAPVVALLFYAGKYAFDKAYGLSIEHISYKTLRGIVSKEQALDILEVKGAVNVATLDTEGFKRKLESTPAIRSATIRAEFPDTLYIEIEERIPIVYVEMESGTHTGDNTRFFMDPDGVIFPVQEEFHRQFLAVPTWYLRPDDVKQLREGMRIDAQKVRPIAELVAAANAYDPENIPRITEIFRPKDWEIMLVLESGTEVTMEVSHIKEQMDRLSMILEHARATGRIVRSANVIPAVNPVAVFAPTQETGKNAKEDTANKADKSDKKKK